MSDVEDLQHPEDEGHPERNDEQPGCIDQAIHDDGQRSKFRVSVGGKLRSQSSAVPTHSGRCAP